MQILLLVFTGVGWLMVGFVMGCASPHETARVDAESAIAIAAVVGVFAALARLLAFQQRGAVASSTVSAGFVVSAWLVGVGLGQCESAGGHHAFPWVMLIPVVAGAVIGAAAAPWIGMAGLWLFVKDADRKLLQEHRARAAARQAAGGGLEANWYLRFCEHCAAELPTMVPADCPECGLLRVQCPACGSQCAVPPSRAVLVRLGQLGRIAWAGVLMAARIVVLPVIWLLAFEVGNRTMYGWPPPAGPIAWGLYLPSDPEVIAMLLMMIAIARVFVFAGRGAVSGALLVTLVIGSATWVAWAEGGNSLSGPGFVQFALVAALAASLVISAGWWCLVRVLPRRKVAMLEDAFTPSRGSLAAGPRNEH